MRLDGTDQEFSVCFNVSQGYDEVLDFFTDNLGIRGWSAKPREHPSDGPRIRAFDVSGNGFKGRFEVIEKGFSQTTLYIDVETK